MAHSVPFRIDAPAGAARQLPARLRRPIDHGCDLLEGVPKDVVEHEYHALRRGQTLQDDQQRHPHALVERDPLGRIAAHAVGMSQRLREPGRSAALTAHSRRTQVIETEPGHYHDEPATNLIDGIGVRAE